MADIGVLQLTLMTTNHLPPAYQQLLATGLSRWIPALMCLLHHYEGIERALAPEERPLDYLADALVHLIDTPAADQEDRLIDAVATMPLFYYRAGGKQTLWIPGNETFRQFERRIGRVTVWQAWQPQLSESEVKQWLHAHLPVPGDARHTA